jgi:DnaK suppressor protein
VTDGLERYRARLQAELHQLQAAGEQSEAAAATVMLDQSSVGRLSRMDAMQQQAMAQGLRERLALRKRKLEAALARLESGRYGLCCQCGAALEAERLDADPSAVFCADCAAEREHG